MQVLIKVIRLADIADNLNSKVGFNWAKNIFVKAFERECLDGISSGNAVVESALTGFMDGEHMHSSRDCQLDQIDYSEVRKAWRTLHTT